jgi:hypothetical protein
MEIARGLRKQLTRSIGVDPAEGGDDTVWTGAGDKGLTFQIAIKTPDTNDIPNRTIALMREHGVKPEDVVFDAGGGGKQHADRLRALGFNVRTIGFGEAATDPLAVAKTGRSYRPGDVKIDEKEIKYIYKNKRAEMYHEFRQAIEFGYGIPEEFEELHRQLKPIPLKYDGEGRIWLPPKHKKDPNSKEETLTEMIGNSPDEADSAVLAYYVLKYPKRDFIVKAG